MIVNVAKRIENLSEYYFSIKLRQVRALQAEGHDVINLGIGNPNFPPANNIISRLTRDARQDDAHGYQPYKGIVELREAMAGFYRNIYRVNPNPDHEVLPLMGSKEGVFYLSMAFLNPGDEVLVPDPGYPGYAGAAKLAGANPVSFPLSAENGWLPLESELQKRISSKTRMMFLNYPHMPTGAEANSNFFERMAGFARRNHLLICHDNPYSLVDSRRPLSALQPWENSDVFVELNSLSKFSNMAGWRVGMLCGRSDYLEAVLRVKSNVDSGQFRPIQKAAITALNAAQSAETYQKQNAVYRKRKSLIGELLRSLNFKFMPDSAGLFVWAEAPPEIPDVEVWLDNLLLEAGVFIAPGKVFGNNGQRYIRVSACADEEKIIEASKRIHNTPGVQQ